MHTENVNLSFITIIWILNLNVILADYQLGHCNSTKICDKLGTWGYCRYNTDRQCLPCHLCMSDNGTQFLGDELLERRIDKCRIQHRRKYTWQGHKAYAHCGSGVPTGCLLPEDDKRILECDLLWNGNPLVQATCSVQCFDGSYLVQAQNTAKCVYDSERRTFYWNITFPTCHSPAVYSSIPEAFKSQDPPLGNIVAIASMTACLIIVMVLISWRSLSEWISRFKQPSSMETSPPHFTGVSERLVHLNEEEILPPTSPEKTTLSPVAERSWNHSRHLSGTSSTVEYNLAVSGDGEFLQEALPIIHEPNLFENCSISSHQENNQHEQSVVPTTQRNQVFLDPKKLDMIHDELHEKIEGRIYGYSSTRYMEKNEFIMNATKPDLKHNAPLRTDNNARKHSIVDLNEMVQEEINVKMEDELVCTTTLCELRDNQVAVTEISVKLDVLCDLLTLVSSCLSTVDTCESHCFECVLKQLNDQRPELYVSHLVEAMCTEPSATQVLSIIYYFHDACHKCEQIFKKRQVIRISDTLLRNDKMLLSYGTSKIKVFDNCSSTLKAFQPPIKVWKELETKLISENLMKRFLCDVTGFNANYIEWIMQPNKISPDKLRILVGVECMRCDDYPVRGLILWLLHYRKNHLASCFLAHHTGCPFCKILPDLFHAPI